MSWTSIKPGSNPGPAMSQRVQLLRRGVEPGKETADDVFTGYWTEDDEDEAVVWYTNGPNEDLDGTPDAGADYWRPNG